MTSAETDEGRAWAETRIKQATGGDPISARFMRQDFFTYKPAYQLFIIGNHKPKLRNITDAMRRRLAMVPFFDKPEKVDKKLEEKLQAEWPGILQWMIDGCLKWRAAGNDNQGLCWRLPKNILRSKIFSANGSRNGWSERNQTNMY